MLEPNFEEADGLGISQFTVRNSKKKVTYQSLVCEIGDL